MNIAWIAINTRYVSWNVLQMLFKFSPVLYFSKYHDCKRRTLFRVFRCHVVFDGIYFFFCICDNRPWYFLRYRFSVTFCLVELLLAIFRAEFVGFACFLVVASERGFLCLSKNLEFTSKQGRPDLRLTLKNAFVCFWLFKRWQWFWKHFKMTLQKTFFAVVVLDDLTIVVT